MQIAFSKYHALGNDYIVINPKDLPSPLTTEQVKTICHRNFGVGSDGILLGPIPCSTAKCALKIYNPDGKFRFLVAGPSAFTEGTKGLDLAVDSKGRIVVLDPERKQVRIFQLKKKV